MAEAKIAGLEIKVDRPLASEALKLQARLMRAAGGLAQKLPGILASRRADATEAEKAKAEADALTAITGLFVSLSPDEYASLVGDLIGLAKIKGAAGHYDKADLDGDFSQNFGAIIPVVLFVLKEVFGDFFSGALANGNRGMRAKA